MSDPVLIKLEGGVFGYGDRAVVRADGIDLRAGRSMGVFGPNGSGKTTLVRGITGLLPPLAGSVLREPGVRVAYLAQHRSMESNWPMSGFDAASMATSALMPLGRLGASARADVVESMRAMNVADLAERSFFSLSAGQQQRLLLAGAMAVRPHLLVLDEPTAGLDVHSRRALLDALAEQTARGLCPVMISHEIEDLVEVCQEVAWLHPAEQVGGPSRVELTAPGEIVSRLAGMGAAR